jgi:histidine phosphotransferase ChpT
VSGHDLAALVGARLCHDLISPMGAIGNGLELLQLAGTGGAEELALVNDSLASALAKLRFYRVAFGPADPGGRQSLEEAAQVTDAMFQGRLTVAWEGAGELSRPVARLAYLAVLCLERSLPMGGRVRIGHAEGELTLRVEGRRTAPPRELWAHLLDGAPPAELKADGVQFALLRRDLVASGRSISARFGEDAAEVGITAPALAEARP